MAPDARDVVLPVSAPAPRCQEGTRLPMLRSQGPGLDVSAKGLRRRQEHSGSGQHQSPEGSLQLGTAKWPLQLSPGFLLVRSLQHHMTRASWKTTRPCAEQVARSWGVRRLRMAARCPVYPSVQSGEQQVPARAVCPAPAL